MCRTLLQAHHRFERDAISTRVTTAVSLDKLASSPSSTEKKHAVNAYSYNTWQGSVTFIRDTANVEWSVIICDISVSECLRRTGVCTQFFRHLMQVHPSIRVCRMNIPAMVACLTKLGFEHRDGNFEWKKSITSELSGKMDTVSLSYAETGIECTPLSTLEKKVADSFTESQMQEIQPGLFLGPFTCLRDHDGLRKHNIRYTLNLSQRCSCIASQIGVHVMDIMIEDEPQVDLLCHLDKAYLFLDMALASGDHVLVNCIAGVSRSASIVVGYLMHKHQWSYTHALEFVRSKRPCIEPNPGFRFQLQCQRMPTIEEQIPLSHEHYSDEDE